MPEARVESIDALKSFKTALVKFAESANVALADAESDIVRTINWLENEQTTYWQMQHRKRSEWVGRCREAVRMKKIFKDSAGRQQSAIEEEKELKKALRMVEESEEKIVAVRKSIKRMEKEAALYKGMVQRFATDVLVEVPAAVSLLENLLRSLEAYASLDTPVEVISSAPAATSSADSSAADTGQSMARSVDELKETDEEAGREAPETPAENRDQ